MDDQKYLLTAQQYNELYCKAFLHLDQISRMAEQAMRELEELQLTMAEESPYGRLIPFPRREDPDQAR